MRESSHAAGGVERAAADREPEDERARQRDEVVKGDEAEGVFARPPPARRAARLAGGWRRCITPEGDERRVEAPPRPEEPGVPARRPAAPPAPRALGAVAEKVGGAVFGDRGDDRRALRRDPVDGGVGEPGERQPPRVDLGLERVPFRGDGGGQRLGRGDERGARGRPQRPRVEGDGEAARLRADAGRGPEAAARAPAQGRRPRRPASAASSASKLSMIASAPAAARRARGW